MNSLSQRDSEVIWHPYTQMQTAQLPIGIVRGEGAYLYAEDGTRYLDMISSWWVNLHGHSHPYVRQKISEQAAVLEHAIFAGFTHAPAVELAERLIKILPGNFARIFYSDNGSTAVEIALKMALQYWYNQGMKKQRIIALKNAYHGDTFGAMSISGRSIFTAPFTDLLFDVEFIEAPSPGNEVKSLVELDDLLNRYDDIAAFIYEPLVQGTAGMVMYSPEMLDKILQRIKTKNIIAIADEVMTGFGRTGKLFASDYLLEKADIVCVSKGITGGFLPLGVTACTSDIYNAFLSEQKTKALFHGHSYTANPLACAAALASMDLLLSPECQASINRISDAHAAFANAMQNHPALSDVRHLGTILAMDIKVPDGGNYLSEIRDRLYNYFLELGLLMRPLGNTIYLIPPYCTSSEDLQYVYQSIENLLNQF